MNKQSRRGFFKHSASLAGVMSISPFLFRSSRADESDSDMVNQFEILSSSTAPFNSVKIIDTDNMPWPPPFNDRGWKSKVLFDNPETGDRLMIIWVPIGAPGGINHYHDFHEWAYWLTGDFVNNEYTSPLQRTGVFQQFREGIFLDRPAFSLHGGEAGRLDSQVGGTCLIMEEAGTTYSVIPEDNRYSDDWKKIKQWTVPRIIDTLSDIPWEPFKPVDGVLVKRLVDDQIRGFRATIWQIPAGWEKSAETLFGRAFYNKQAHEFNFVLNGDMRIQTFQTPEKQGEEIVVKKSFYVERPPMSILGIVNGKVSNEGCVWLQVTYGKGTAINNVPIEAPNYI